MTQTEAKRKLLMDQLQEWRRVHIKLEDRSQELDRSEQPQFEAEQKKSSFHECALCGEKTQIEEGEENSGNFALKLHYTSHFLEQRPEMFLGLVSSTYGGQHIKNFRCPYIQCTPRAMFLKELNLHLSTSHELLRTCLKEDKRPGMAAVCSLLYPKVEEEESHPIVTVKQERLDPEPELEMENDNETLDDPDDDTLQETVSATNQSIKLNTSFSQDPYSLGVKVPGDQNQKLVTNPPDKFVSYSQSKIVQNTNKDKDTSSPVGTNSRVMGGNLSSQKLTNRNEQIEVVEKKFDPTNYNSNDPAPKTASERPNLRPRKISDYSELQPNFSDFLPSPPRTVEASSANKLFKNSYKQTPSRPSAAKTRVPRRQSANMNSTVNQTVTCLLCKESTGTKLKLGENSVEAMEHYKVCLYNQGLLQMLVDAGRENLDENNQVLDPFGKKFLYKCGCKTEIKMRGRPSPSHMSYKEYVFHCYQVHGVWRKALEIEREAAGDEDKEKFDNLMTALALREGQDDVVPPVTIEEIHTCLLCNGITKEGKERKDARNLEMMQCVTLNHYATCLYEQEDGLKFYEETYPIPADLEAPSTTTKYQFYCPDEGCKRSKRLQGGVGYKQYVTHQALYHGGLELYIETRAKQELRDMLPKLRCSKVSGRCFVPDHYGQ